jgi:hypothetical protein
MIGLRLRRGCGQSVTTETALIVPLRIAHAGLVRIVTGDASDARITFVPTPARLETVRLETEIKDSMFAT